MKGVSMTENEAKDKLDSLHYAILNCSFNQVVSESEMEALCMAKDTLSEIQQYRAIGTVEQLEWCKDASHWKKLFKEKLEKYEAIGTIEEFKALKEKNIAKKPRFYAHNYYCTECGNLVGNNEFEWQRFLYCDKCGQKLDWQ